MGTQHQRPRTQRNRAHDELYRYSGMGLQFSATLVIFGLVGRWLDGRLKSGPWLLIAGVFVGFGLGLLSMVKKLPTSSPPRTRPDSTGASNGPEAEDPGSNSPPADSSPTSDSPPSDSPLDR